MKTALLSLDDLPAGWTTSPDTGDDSTSQLCGAPPTTYQSVKVSADFQKSQLGPFLVESIGVFKPGEAKAWMDTRQKATNCTSWTDTDSQGTPTTYQLSPLSFPKMGDQTFAFRLTVGEGLISAESDIVYIRTGDYVLLIGNIGVGSVDSDLTTNLTQKALDKLGAYRK